jgi:hypothetical protein
MDIQYNDDDPVYNGTDLKLDFTVLVDGEPVTCSISVEALENYFGARPPLEEKFLEVFRRGQKRIRAACTAALEHNGGQSVILRSGAFRMDEAG